MRKILIILFVCVFFTGCSLKEVDRKNISKTIDIILSQNINLSTISARGYKYYLPKGVSLVENAEYNDILISSGNTYYLYIDIVSYHYQKDISYEINEEAYLSKRIENNSKQGYLEVNQMADKYFVEMMYNYSKVEAYVDKNDILDTIINMSYILSSIKYNDNVIVLLFDESVSEFEEETFQIFEPKGREGNFLDYIKEYDKYEETDEDVISSDLDNIE